MARTLGVGVADLLDQSGVDRDDYRMCFGPTNVAIWSVDLAGPALIKPGYRLHNLVRDPLANLCHNIS